MPRISKHVYQQLLAVHEAGHAVAADLLGLQFHSVSAVPNDYSGGRLSYVSTGLSLEKINNAKHPQSMMKRSSLKFAIVGLSGWAAEQAFFEGFRGCSRDDFKKVGRSIRPDFELPEVLSRATYLFSHREVLAAVERLADDLTKCDVSRQEVRQLVGDVIGRSVAKRIASRVLAAGELAIRRDAK